MEYSCLVVIHLTRWMYTNKKDEYTRLESPLIFTHILRRRSIIY